MAVFDRLLQRRADRAGRAVALAAVAVGARNEAERLRRAHENVLALYVERGRELERLHDRIAQLEAELEPPAVRAA